MSEHASPDRVPDGKDEKAGNEDGYQILSYLLAGVLFYGGLGWVGDHFFHTRFCMPLGIMLGSVLSLYMVVKRFGGSGSTTTSTTGNPRQGEESE